MTPEVQMLAATGLLALTLTVIQAVRNVVVLGLTTAVGTQEDLPEWKGWHDRLNRALRNLIEATAIFAPIVIALILSNQTTDATGLGAQIFFGARVAHVILFMAAIPFLRTMAWFVGVIGIGIVGWPLVT